MKVIHFSFLKRAEGGQSFDCAKRTLEEAGVTDIQREASPYVGHNALSVPRKFARRTERLMFGR